MNLFEMPYLHTYPLPFKAISNISINTLNSAYDFLGKISDDVGVYRHNAGGGIIAGSKRSNEFFLMVAISVKPTTGLLLSNALQISMVRVNKGQQQQGLVRQTYSWLTTQYDIVSDREQYLGAQALWKSIARRPGKVNIYVYDGQRKDYVRNEQGIVRYNGTNIDDTVIWGQESSYKKVLLVATMKDLK